MHGFRAAIEARDVDAALDHLAEDVVFRSPVVFRPVTGRETVRPILHAVSRVFENFRYVRQIGADEAADAALIFRATVAGRLVDGCDFIHLDRDGLVGELTVMVRPLSAALVLAEAMHAQLSEAGHDEPSGG